MGRTEEREGEEVRGRIQDGRGKALAWPLSEVVVTGSFWADIPLQGSNGGQRTNGNCSVPVIYPALLSKLDDETYRNNTYTVRACTQVMEAVSDVLSRQPALPFEDQIAYLSLFTEENILGYHMVNFLLMFSVGYSMLAVMQPSARVTDLRHMWTSASHWSAFRVNSASTWSQHLVLR